MLLSSYHSHLPFFQLNEQLIIQILQNPSFPIADLNSKDPGILERGVVLVD